MNNFNVNQNGFNDYQISDALQRQMADNGAPCDKQIILDGKFHRYSKDQKKNQPDEWYTGTGLWKYKTDERVIIELGLAVIYFIRAFGFEELLTLCTQVLLRQLTSFL